LQNIKLVGISQQVWRDYAIDQQGGGPLWVIFVGLDAHEECPLFLRSATESLRRGDRRKGPFASLCIAKNNQTFRM
jgi:hypothetical protein